jgi:hypothetical protein
VASKEIGLEVMLIKITTWSCLVNAGRSLSTKFDNNSFEMLVEFKYSGTALTNKNYIHLKIKRRLKTTMHCVIRYRVFCLVFWYSKFERLTEI